MIKTGTKIRILSRDELEENGWEASYDDEDDSTIMYYTHSDTDVTLDVGMVDKYQDMLARVMSVDSETGRYACFYIDIDKGSYSWTKEMVQTLEIKRKLPDWF